MDRNESPRVKFLAKKWGQKLADRSAADHSLPQDGKAFDLLIEADPTKSKEYLDWICRTYFDGSFFLEDCDRVKNTLVLFHRWKRRLPQTDRDIGRHSTEQSVWACVEKFDPSKSGEDDNPEGRELRRRERAKALAESDMLDADDLGGWIVASPRTLFASQWWGRGTRWCTAMQIGHHYHSYTASGPLRVFVTPDGDKFQAHVASKSCADSADRMIDFHAFVTKLPLSAVDLLKADVKSMFDAQARAGDVERLITSIPGQLLDEETFRTLRAKGLERVKVLVEAGDWKLKLVSDSLSKWALGLRAGDRNSWSSPNFLVLDCENGKSVNAELDAKSCAPIRQIAISMGEAPSEFQAAAAIQISKLWESRNGYRNAAGITAFTEAFQHDKMPAEAWLALAERIAKKPRDWYEFAIPHQFVDEAVADALAHGWSLSAIPLHLVTKERIKSFVSRHPQLAERELAAYGNGQAIDHEIAMAIASCGSGSGLEFVPSEMKTEEFCLEVLSLYPRALKFVPESFLTSEACLSAVSRVGQLIDDVPARFRCRELYLGAVTQNGGVLCSVPEEFRDEEVSLAALRSNPDQFPHVRIPLSYESYLKGVASSGSMLARVPLVFRDLEMCRAAVSKQADALAHVPPKVAAVLVSELPQAYPTSIRLSSRYPKNDPIHWFEPSDDRPDSLPPLSPAGQAGVAATALRTGPAIEHEPEALAA